MPRMTKVAAALFLALGASFAAQAAEDPVSLQSGHWVVGPISGGKFCSMKNTWQGGVRLVFASDAKGTHSIAVDFGAAVLEAGRQYPVTLDLPPVTTRDMTAVAATRDILLVGMGKDKDFHAALARATGLYLSALNREYGFDLAGSGDALRELDDCAFGLSGARRAESPVAAPAPQKQKQARVDSPAKKKVKAQVAVAPEIKPEALEKAEAQIARLSADLARAAEAQKQAESLKAENTRLRNDLSSAQGRAAEEQKAVQAQIEELSAENGKLKNALAASADARVKHAALDAENARLRRDLSDLRAKAKEGQDAVASYAVSKRRIAALEAENARLSAALEKAEYTLKESAAALLPPISASSPSVAEGDAVGRILAASGLVSVKEAAMQGDKMTFSWKTGEAIGSAERVRLAPGEDVGARVSGLLDRMAVRCGSDFARRVSPPEAHGGVTLQKAEMACIGEKDGAAATLLFLSDGNTFTSVMHEAAPGNMEDALTGREAVALAAARQ